MMFALFIYLKILEEYFECFSHSKEVPLVVIKNLSNFTLYIYSIVQTVIN